MAGESLDSGCAPSHDWPPFRRRAANSFRHVYLQISRQKLSKDWHKKLQAIKAKAAELFKNLPPELSLPEGDAVEYGAVKAIRDTMAKTAEKTFFGNLTGTAGLWDKVLRAYEKDSKALLMCLPPGVLLTETAVLDTPDMADIRY